VNHLPTVAPICIRVLFLLLSIPALATATDQVGIYFDESYQNNSLIVPDANTVVTGYLVLSDPATTAGVAGWELCVGIDGPAMFLNWELEGQVINVLNEPCFQVGVGDAPLPGGSRVLLATFTMLVEEPLPVALSVNLINHPSIPDEMAYLTNDDPQEIRPLAPVTDEATVAWINHGIPFAEVSPPYWDFFDVPLGTMVDHDIVVSNIGGGSLFLDISIDGGDGVFTLPGVSGPATINAGESLSIPIRFQPTAVQFYEGKLNLGNPIAPNPLLLGEGRDLIADWDVDPELIFEETFVGHSITRELVVSNIGELPLDIFPSLPNDCTVFSILDPGSYTIEPGMELSLSLAFTPEDDGPVSCELDLGSVVDSVLLTGYGHVPILDYSVNPPQLFFPDVAVGSSVLRNFILSNTGEGPLVLTIEMDEPFSPFSISNGGGSRTLQPSEEVLVSVIFSPQDVGEFGAEVNFGNPVLDNYQVSGAGVDVNMSCVVTPENLDFGDMMVGSSYTRHITVHNDGNLEFFLAPDTSCPFTTVAPAQAAIVPGNSRTFSVTYLAQETGPWECVVSLGQSQCSEVICSGVVTQGPSPDDNLVGLFFDDEFSQISTIMASPGLVEAHLVLLNPTDPEGVSGWECRFEIVGELCLLVGTELMGQAINVGEFPDLQVGLGEPLPWSPSVHLATFQLFLLQGHFPVSLHLLPINTPSIPDEMVWLSADHSQIIPMRPHTGWSEVATINTYYVALETPAPDVVMQGSLVELTWAVQDNSNNSYLVYRRGETGPAELLFDQSLTAQGGTFIYRDSPRGFEAGTHLHYSYAVLQNGVEVARSPETDIVLSGLPAAMTRLLPNVPNPFNPLTTVNFELKSPGKVRVSIYDVSGRLVNTLVNESMSAGPHARRWMGKDLSGRQVPSGTYYLRMETDGRIDHRKMLLLK